jgi:hypothetical protein
MPCLCITRKKKTEVQYRTESAKTDLSVLYCMCLCIKRKKKTEVQYMTESAKTDLSVYTVWEVSLIGDDDLRLFDY